MRHLSQRHIGLFRDDELTYNEQLNKCAKSLRNSAQKIVFYISNLSQKSKSLQALEKAYKNLEEIPIKDLCVGIEEIKKKLLSVEFLSKSSVSNHNAQSEFERFFELQNEFNAEVNAFVKKVIQLEVIN